MATKKNKKDWIAGATASIKRRGTAGKCTPITKPGCTGRARTLALTFKKIARSRKKEDGGFLLDEFDNLPKYGGDQPSGYLPQRIQPLGLDTSMDTTSMSALKEMPEYTPMKQGFNMNAMPYGMIGDFASEVVSPFLTPDEISGGQVDINEGGSAVKGALKGAGTGAAIGSVIPGIGTAIGAGAGALIGGVSSFLGAGKKEERLQEGLDEKRQLQVSQMNRSQRLSNLQPQESYIPVAAKGGFISYKGQSHEGNNGGVPVDQQGNPTFITHSEPVALTEGKEVTWYSPDQGAYVFSDKLGFAEPAQKLVNKYKLDEKNIDDPVLKEAVDKQFENLRTNQELIRKKPKKKKIPMKQYGGDLYEDRIPGTLPAYSGDAFNMDINVPYAAGRSPMMSPGISPGQNIGRPVTGRSPNYLSTLMGRDPGGLDAANYTNLMPGSSRFGQQYLGAQRGYGDWQQEVGYNQGAGYTAVDPVIDQRMGLQGRPDLLRGATDEMPGRIHESVAPAAMKSSGIPESMSWKTPATVSTELATPMDQESFADTTEEDYNPMLSPLGHGLSAIGSIADYYAMKKARPEELALPRVGPERVSYARQRLADREQANIAAATSARTARNVGLGGGQAMANISAARLGIGRQLGQQLTTSSEREANRNALLRQQAGMTNAQIAMQEGLYNNRLQNAYRAQMAQMNPLGGLARTAAGYFKESAAYQRGWDTLRMISPSAEIYEEPGTTWLDKLLGETRGVRFKGAPLKYETNE